MGSEKAVRLAALIRGLVQDARTTEDLAGRAGLPSSLASVLGVLADHGGIRLGRLAQLLGVDPSVASRHVAHAYDEDLVVREADPLDGRASLLALTPDGHERLAIHRAARGALLDQVLSGWTDDEVDALIDALARLRDDARAFRAAAPTDPARRPTGWHTLSLERT